jgi:hypothetical protein
MRNLCKHSSEAPREAVGGCGQNGAFQLNHAQKGRHVMYAKLLDSLAPHNLPAGEMILCDTGDQRTAELRRMTEDQLLRLGTRQVVYLQAGTCEGEMVFVIYSADGNPIVMVEDLETAMETVAEQGLIIVAVH